MKKTSTEAILNREAGTLQIDPDRCIVIHDHSAVGLKKSVQDPLHHPLLHKLVIARN